MTLRPLASGEHAVAAAALAASWKSRGMPQYDERWAAAYLREGHRKEIERDEVLGCRVGKELVGIVSLVTFAGGVAEVRDESLYRVSLLAA